MKFISWKEIDEIEEIWQARNKPIHRIPYRSYLMTCLNVAFDDLGVTIFENEKEQLKFMVQPKITWIMEGKKK